MITQTVTELPAVTDDQRGSILTAPRTAQSHRKLLAELPAMNAVQLGGAASTEQLAEEFTVAALERGTLSVSRSDSGSSVKITPRCRAASEVDHGMARTAQRHTTEAVAAELGMAYAFGVEFHELDLGGPTERAFCADSFNTLGWHGNAICLRPHLNARL